MSCIMLSGKMRIKAITIMSHLLKYLCSVLLLFFVFITSAFGQYDSILHNGVERTFLVHLPHNYDENNSYSLIVAMHGGFGSAYNLQEQSQLSKKADEANFIVVYPEGIKGGILNIRTWNAGDCCGYASRTNVDDVGFIGALIDTLIDKFSIDLTRIYATGMSNGGFMAYRLACEIPNRIAAIAPVAASMSFWDCIRKMPVPIIAFHSYLDFNVKHGGGQSEGVDNNRIDSSQQFVMNYWSEINDCNVLQDTIKNDAEITFVKWTSCNCGTELHHYTTKDGGHSWPGGKKTLIGDPVSEFINANDLMWDFFQRFSTECRTTSTRVNPNNLQIYVYPNPTSGTIKVSVPVNKDYHVKLTDIFGREILTLPNPSEIDLSKHPDGFYFITVKLGMFINK